MKPFGHDLREIAAQDRRTIAETRRAFKEAIRVVRREKDEKPAEVLARIIGSRHTFKVPLSSAIRLYTHDPVTPEPAKDRPRRCRREGCTKHTSQTSYYWCGAHIPEREEVDEDFLRSEHQHRSVRGNHVRS